MKKHIQRSTQTLYNPIESLLLLPFQARYVVKIMNDIIVDGVKVYHSISDTPRRKAVTEHS